MVNVPRAVYLNRAESGHCPCCGRLLENKPDLEINLRHNTATSNGKCFQMQPQHAEILYLLQHAYPDIVAYERIHQRVWASKDLEDPKKSLQTAVCIMRRQLERVGWGIKTVWGQGVRLVKL